MKIELNELTNNSKFDFCIIGTGPAGITVARKLARAGKKVALLEGGDEQYSQESQDLYGGEIVGDKYFPLDTSRLRFFGGTSNHWAGWCKQLDEEDFDEKGEFSKTKWPISKKDLDLYLTEASYVLELSKQNEDRDFSDSGLRQSYFTFSHPTVRFAKKYGDEIIYSKNITLILNANVTSFQTNGSSVTSVGIYNESKESIHLRANKFILAAGGIENSRLLLWANKLTNGELIKNSSMLGRYWMEHPVFTVGQAILTGDLAMETGKKGIAFLSPTKKTMLEQKILNCSLRFEPVSYKGAKKIISDLACVAPSLGRWAFDLLDRELLCGARLRASWEQEPVATNRIELSDDLDRLGMPRPTLYWKKNKTDLRTVRKTAEVFGNYLAKENIGRIKLDDWVLGKADYPEDDELAGYHHMGGTRMASSSAEGIVDSNCKIFGQNNFFVAGSSVFPSSGYANPTLPIVQLALRLGDHLLQQS